MTTASKPRPLNIAYLACFFMLATASLSFSQTKTPTSAAKSIDLIGTAGLEAWNSPAANWQVVAEASLNPRDDRRLSATPGQGVLYNGPEGRAVNLISRQFFEDVQLHVEFMVPKNSNSGVKLQGVYEIQIFDSFGLKTVNAGHSGGIYPRAEMLPRYHHIDDGYPPKTNAALAPGAWQSLDITFRSPKFDPSGKKIANARFDKVVLNGQVVQENQEVPSPTGHVWREKEHPNGPILLQGDHGPVAFRNVRAAPLPSQ